MKFAKLIIAAAISFAAAAQADTFNYSYTFHDGSVVSGSFDGTVSGNLITNLSNISAAIDGIAFNEPMAVYSVINGQLTSAAAVASFDGTQSNFYFINSDSINNPNNPWKIFAIYNEPFYVNTIGTSNSAFANNSGTGQNPYDNLYFDYNTGSLISGYTPANWTLTNVSAVPEPESFALMLAGLGLMGAVARRRKNGTA